LLFFLPTRLSCLLSFLSLLLLPCRAFRLLCRRRTVCHVTQLASLSFLFGLNSVGVVVKTKVFVGNPAKYSTTAAATKHNQYLPSTVDVFRYLFFPVAREVSTLLVCSQESFYSNMLGSLKYEVRWTSTQECQELCSKQQCPPTQTKVWTSTSCVHC
jgi:hypothetical protein